MAGSSFWHLKQVAGKIQKKLLKSYSISLVSLFLTLLALYIAVITIVSVIKDLSKQKKNNFTTKEWFTKEFNMRITEERHEHESIKFTLKMPTSKMAWVRG